MRYEDRNTYGRQIELLLKIREVEQHRIHPLSQHLGFEKFERIHFQQMLK